MASVSGAIKRGTAGATITAGQALYMDAADSNKLKLADCDASLAAAAVVGIALDGAASGQPVCYQSEGEYNPGATATVGTIYVASGTAGGIAPVADLASADYTTVIGVGITASKIKLGIIASNVQVP